MHATRTHLALTFFALTGIAVADTFDVHPGESIQLAIDAANHGDDVIVHAGTYTERINLSGKAITLRGADGADVTILDGDGLGSVITCTSSEGSDTVIEGLTITNGYAVSGAGLFIENASPTVRDCIFEHNTATGDTNGNPLNWGGGGAIYADGGTHLTLTGCTFRHNSGTPEIPGWVADGGALHIRNVSVTMDNCNFHDNSCNHNGGAVFVRNRQTTIRGCSFTDNAAIDPQNALRGGAVYLELVSATIEDSTFTRNAAEQGAGLYADNGANHVSLTRCTFTDNDGVDGLYHHSRGGGLFMFGGTRTLEACTFTGNTARDGGAVVVGNETTMIACTFTGNTATHGGGGAAELNGNATLKGCVFEQNRANGNDGGAIDAGNSSTTITNCAFSQNEANRHGGAIYGSSIEVANSIFTGNFAEYGGGAYLRGDSVVNCNLHGNSASVGAGAIHLGFGTSATVVNSIMTANTSEGSSPTFFVEGGTLSVNHSFVDGGWPGVGNISGNPLFVDADGADDILGTLDDDLRLIESVSPCIDAGDNNAIPADVADLDGDGDITEQTPFDFAGRPRYFDDVVRPDTGHGGTPMVDMGAFETQKPLTTGLADLDGDNDVDLVDFAAFQAQFTGESS